MSSSEIQIGIVGASGRGGWFIPILNALSDCHVAALCDTNTERLRTVAEQTPEAALYDDYSRMLAEARIDAVLIATPMPLHLEQTLPALERGLHVLVEVPATVSLEESRRLTEACRRARGLFMMGENYCWFRGNQMIDALVKAGKLGTPYYAEGEYSHDIRTLTEVTRWRRHWQFGIDGITYGTHSLGPILRWLAGDRVTRICCVGSGHHYADAAGKPYEAQALSMMLCQTARGALLRIRTDMQSARPAGINFHLQGTRGVVDCAWGWQGERNRVWLDESDGRVHAPASVEQWVEVETGNPRSWRDLAELEAEFLPQGWRVDGERALKLGHNGSDFFMLREFLAAIRAGGPSPIDIDAAMDMVLPGQVSQQSIAHNGEWLEVPDSRAWGRARAH